MDSHERFNSRASAYVRGRPGYPAALVERIATVQEWRAGRVVADIGSGTGIFTQEILQRGARVLAVEPSEPMRREAERELGHIPGFNSVDGMAAATALEDQSVDAIACAQAFHWFNREDTRAEWRRILRPQGTVALIWNFIDTDHPIGRAYYEFLVASGPSAREVIATSLATAQQNVLFPAGVGERYEVLHGQPMDWRGLLARVHSSSYLPKSDEPGYAAMLERLEDFFRRSADKETITLPHRAVAIHGLMPG